MNAGTKPYSVRVGFGRSSKLITVNATGTRHAAMMAARLGWIVRNVKPFENPENNECRKYVAVDA